LFVLAYNLGNFLRRLALPSKVSHWSLRSVQLKLIKICAKVVNHARRTIFQCVEWRSLKSCSPLFWNVYIATPPFRPDDEWVD